MKLKSVVGGIVAVTLSLGMVVGCTKKQASVSVSSDTKEPVTITWYLRHQEQKDADIVLAEINKVVKEKINATLVIKRVDNYVEKLKLALAANENFDIAHMAPRYDYYSHVAKGAFLPLDELLTKYAPKTYAEIPERFWDAARIGGKIYGVINYQIVGRQQGFVVQKYALDKYNFNLNSVKKLEDMEPLFKELKENEPNNTVVFDNNKGGLFGFALTHYVGFDNIGSSTQPGAIMANDTQLKVVNQYETEEFRTFIKLMRDWYLKGYIKKDAATATGDTKSQGTVMSWVDMVGLGFEPTFAKMLGNRPVQTVVIDPPFVDTESLIATMNSVSRTSKNPERAMMFLELMNTNEGNIYNTMCFGIEGKHYKKIDNKRIEKIPDSGYDPNAAWMFGNQFNAYLMPGQEDDLWAKTKKLNEEATTSLLMGFSLDIDPIKIEIAQCQAVMNEYIPSLCSGSVDIDTFLPEFLSKLKKANVDKIIIEKQRQVDEWKSRK